MQLIPLKKRLLYYLALLPISLIVTYIAGALTTKISDKKEICGFALSIPIALLCVNYVFSVFFLKTKLLLKFIVPIVTTLFSGGFLLLMTKYNFYFDNYDFFGQLLIQIFLIIVIVWEITYQILKITANQNNQINHSSDNN